MGKDITALVWLTSIRWPPIAALPDQPTAAADATALHLGFGRIVASEIEVPNMLADIV